eukprot:2954556-Rhodomonas_salina.1
MCFTQINLVLFRTGRSACFFPAARRQPLPGEDAVRYTLWYKMSAHAEREEWERGRKSCRRQCQKFE